MKRQSMGPRLLTGRPAFLAAGAGTLALVSFALAHVHGAMHTPRDRWIERQRWFTWLDRRHYVHHVNLRANLNFMLPLCDHLFGSDRPGRACSSACDQRTSAASARPLAAGRRRRA